MEVVYLRNWMGEGRNYGARLVSFKKNRAYILE